jgi:hypothetical protein
LDDGQAPKTDRYASTAERRSTIPWGVAGMIGLIVAIECFVTRNWLDFTDPVSLSWRYSADAVQTESTGCDVLCLGDSLIKHGLIPGVVETGTGLRTANVSAARAPALLTYFLLRRVFDTGPRPQAIIINAKPAVLMGGPEFNARYWQEVLTLRECLDLWRMTGDGSIVLSTLVGRVLPSLRSRLEIQSNVLAALRGETDRIPAINRVLLRNWTVNRGANVAAAELPRHDPSALDVEHRLHPGVFYVDRTNFAGLERLLRLADERNIRVFWLLPPISRELQARRDQSGAEAKYEQLIQSLAVRYPQLLTVLDARRGAYPSTLFTDHTHLNGQGAVALSRAVATAIKTVLTRPRSVQTPAWLALSFPSDHPGELRAPLEDLEQSKAILHLDETTFISSR